MKVLYKKVIHNSATDNVRVAIQGNMKTQFSFCEFYKQKGLLKHP